MKTAQTIINDARFELITHIITLMRKLDAYFISGKKCLMTAPDEDVVIDFAECLSIPDIRVRVDNSYLDVEDECYEMRTLDFLETTDDHNFAAGVTLANGGTVDASEISTDDLLVIAKVLEDTYQNAEEV